MHHIGGWAASAIVDSSEVVMTSNKANSTTREQIDDVDSVFVRPLTWNKEGDVSEVPCDVGDSSTMQASIRSLEEVAFSCPKF